MIKFHISNMIQKRYGKSPSYVNISRSAPLPFFSMSKCLWHNYVLPLENPRNQSVDTILPYLCITHFRFLHYSLTLCAYICTIYLWKKSHMVIF
jgi:hypothetical protein